MTRTDQILASILATLYAVAALYAGLTHSDWAYTLLYSLGAVGSTYVAVSR